MITSVFIKQCSSTTPLFFFFFNDTATTEIYTLSLHDALPISSGAGLRASGGRCRGPQRVHVRSWAQAALPEFAAAWICPLRWRRVAPMPLLREFRRTLPPTQ